MPVSCTGAEWREFLADEEIWRGGRYYDDLVLEVNGFRHGNGDGLLEATVPPKARVAILGGDIYSGEEGVFTRTVAAAFQGWRRSRDKVTMVVECRKHRAGSVRDAIRGAGGRVRR